MGSVLAVIGALDDSIAASIDGELSQILHFPFSVFHDGSGVAGTMV